MPNFLLNENRMVCLAPVRPSEQTQELWNKIRIAICETGLNLICYFKPLDPDGIGHVKESQFIDILCKCQHLTGISVKDIEMLVQQFGVQEKYTVMVNYVKFLDTVEGNLRQVPARSKLLVFSKCLSTIEKMRLDTLLRNISQFLRKREVCIQKYLEDYDNIADNEGTITFTHFFRLLHQIGIKLPIEDFRLICKRFLVDGYGVNYFEFVEGLEAALNSDTDNYPSNLKKSIEIVKNTRKASLLPQYAFHTSFNNAKEDKDFVELIKRIKRHIFENRIRSKEFFCDYDPLRSGFITTSQFKRCLDILGLSKLNRLVVTPKEVECLCCTFANPDNSDQIYWMEFVKEIDTVFTVDQLDKKPHEVVKQPPQEIECIKKEGLKECVPSSDQLFCCATVHKIRDIIEKRRIYMEPFFRMFDKLNTCHVTPAQMRQVFTANCFPLEEREFAALEIKYKDHIGFDYMWFLKEADPQEFGKHFVIPVPTFKYRIPRAVPVNLQHVMCKIKNQVIRKRLTLLDFLKEHDRKMERCIHEYDFRRGLDNSGISLKVPEVDAICESFKSCIRPGAIDYRKFCTTVEQPASQTIFEATEPDHITNNDGPLNRLSVEERQKVSCALHKLCRFPDNVSNISSLFQNYDKTNIGTITVEQFKRVLKTRDLMQFINDEEFNLICKCFCFERGLKCEVEYRAFLTTIETLFDTVVI